MTNERLYEVLTGILNSIDEEEYPQIVDTISYNMDDEGNVFADAFEIACELHEADNTKAFPAVVADFLSEVYLEEIENHNADAACNLGSLYYTGRIGPRDFELAVKYYTIAAEGGCRAAQENLGYCYYYGRTGEKDYQKAFHYFALGAFDGHLNSLYKIGDMYRNGFYVEKSEIEAFRIYQHCLNTLTETAVPLVGADIMMRMGDCYFEGIGTEPDYSKAMTFYQKSEGLYYDRLMQGDYLIQRCYDKVVERQSQVRKAMQEKLPSFDWATQTKE